MKKCFIFAHYDFKNEIKQYIIDEINLLNKLGDVLFISDCNYIKNIQKLPKVKYIQISRHNLYDAHSYMCGFRYLKFTHILNDYDSITFVNSSIVFPKCTNQTFIKALIEIDNCEEKVYGMCKSKFMLQSYWITCKKETYDFIDKFIENYKPAKNKNIKKWLKKYKFSDTEKKWINRRTEEVGRELTLKWIYTVINFEEGFSRYLYHNHFKLIALDYGRWPKSRFITKYPREKVLNDIHNK